MVTWTRGFYAALLFVAVPLLAKQPSADEVNAAYDRVRIEVCTAAGITPCPAGFGATAERQYYVQKYCAANNASPACTEAVNWPPVATLEFDHITRRWTARGDLEQRTEKDINGIPTISLKRKEAAVVVVVSTNPLLYSVVPGEVKQENIEQLADLQKAASLLGATFATVLPTAGVATSGDPFDIAADNLASESGLQPTQCIADKLTRQAFDIASFIEAVERDRAALYTLSPPPLCGANPVTSATVRQTWTTLFDAPALAKSFCPDAIDAAIALLNGDEAGIAANILLYRAAAASPLCVRFAQPLIDDQGQQVLSLNDSIEQFIIRPIETTSTKAMLDAIKTQRLRGLQKVKTALSGVPEASAKAIASAATVNKAAEQVERFRARVVQNQLRPAQPCAGAKCASSADIARFIVVPTEATKVRWDKIHTQPLKLSVDTPYAADVVPSRAATVDTLFKARTIDAAAWDIGVAVTSTRLKSPTFGVVDSTIVVTDEESRAGNLAMMFNYLPLKTWASGTPSAIQALGVQIGTGIDTKKPAFFYGISYGLGKYIRIGWGGTSQRVTQLREHEVGFNPITKEELRTRQGFENGHYWSLTISIGSVKLFTSN